MGQEAQEGDTVKVHYTGTLNNGDVFDTSEGKEPFEFTLGEGQVIQGFDDAVVGMEEGDEKEVEIAKDDAYGDRNPELVQEVPKEQFGDQEVQEGMMLAVQSQDGQQIPATVTEVGESTVTIDMNPPLAGKDLNFEIELVSVE
jgi:peptidylprolyl isomerase